MIPPPFAGSNSKIKNQPLYIKQLELGPMQNFVYLVGDPKSHEAAVVDPGWEVSRILKAIQDDGYRLTHALITHTHFDHTNGISELLKAADIPVYVHRGEAGSLKLEETTIRPVSGGDTVKVGNIIVNLIHTPGHTPGSQCLLVNGYLLSGDTLFVGSCGRCDMPGGDAKALYHSLHNTLKELDDETLLCPGHNYGAVEIARLGDEKRTNPFLRLSRLEEFLSLTGA